jgi:hypothetical protein
LIFSHKIPLLFSRLSRSFRFSPMSCAHSGAHNASQRRRYFSSIIIIIIIIYISGFFTGLARSSLRAIDEGEKTTRAHGFPLRLCESRVDAVRAHTQHTHRRPSRVVNPTVCTAKDVSRAAAVELFTTYVSRLSARISSFAKFSKFRVFLGQNKKTNKTDSHFLFLLSYSR